MSLENYQGTAIDPNMFKDEGQSNTELETKPQIEDGASIEPEDTGAGEPATTPSTTPTEFEIDGIGKVTAKDIQEWRQGSLRQSDYTKKTQEVARQKEELKEAVEVYNYLKQNPQLVEHLKQADGVKADVIDMANPNTAMIKDLAYKQKAMETDLKLAELKSKYGNIDEIAILQKATELRTEDLEFVHKALRFDSTSGNDAVAKAKAELQAELEQNRKMTGTTISTRQGQSVQQNTVSLSDDEKRVASGMGMSEAEYAKWVRK